jgi:molecular chaperone GrpE
MHKKHEETKGRNDEATPGRSDEATPGRSDEVTKDAKVVLSAEEYETLRKKAEERDTSEDKWLRAHAEIDNARKRMERERAEHIKYANEDIILKLIGILDNFERGIRSAEQKKDFGMLHQGVDMILKELHQLLEEKGLKRIKCVGEKFDPYKHEALEVVGGEADKDGTVAEELQSGYELNGRVIRPAKVRVFKVTSDE